jgi:hypothetical protein
MAYASTVKIVLRVKMKEKTDGHYGSDQPCA